MASNVLDDIATRFVAFSDALEASFGDISIDFSLPSMTAALPGSKAGRAGGRTATAAPRPGDAKALAAAAEERAAARKRGEEILAQLPLGYFDRAFDPLEHELRQMAPDASQDDVDGVADKLTAAMEVVGMQLAKHVLNNKGKLIAGISNVTLVEDDLRAAFVVCQGTRAQLRVASDEVQRQIKIITSTRKKRDCLELYEALRKVQQVQDLPAALRRVHEEGDYAEGILLCVDCFKAVDELRQFEIAPALQLSVQRAYYDAMQRMTAALQAVCADFKGDGYSRLLEAYLLQAVPGEALADKVLSCFRGMLQDVATRLVRSTVLARLAFQQPAGADDASAPPGGGSGDRGFSSVLEEGSFAELCRRVPPESLGPCLLKLLESMFDQLASYAGMEQWQAAGLAQHSQAAAAAAAAAAVAAAPLAAAQLRDATSDAPPDAAASQQQQLDHVQAATKSMLSAVHAALVSNRVSFAETASVLLKDLLVGAGGCRGSDLPQVVECALRFAALSEAFAGCSLPMRGAYLHVLGAFVKTSHKSNMQALKQALAAETWGQAVGGDGGGANGALAADISSIATSLSSSSSSYSLAAHRDAGFVGDFGAWVKHGNPFRSRGASARAAGGPSLVVDEAAGRLAVQAECSTHATTSSSPSGSPPPPAALCQVSARNSLLVLRWLADYAGLMAPLPGAQPALWVGMAELFDNFLLACFILFGGISLETLVWHNGCLPTRLRNALLRITTSSGCKYRAEVEELICTKPAAVVSPTSAGSNISSGTAGGGGSGVGKLDVFTRKFKDTMVELINTDLSQPLPEGSSLNLTPRQTHPAPPAAQQQQARPEVQASPQAQLGFVRSAQADCSSSGRQAGSPGQQQGGVCAAVLRQRVAAIESLSAIADALRAAKPGLRQRLSASGLAREVEGYFARTVDAAADLRDAIYTSGAKQLMPVLADAEYGVAAQIAACAYNVREPATRYQPWVEVVVKQFQRFATSLAASGLGPDMQLKMWEAAVTLGAEALLDGFSSVRRCSLEGRAAMSLDLSAVEKGLRAVAPAAVMSSLRVVDAYIKAFYIPFEELGRWAQTHAAEYGRRRLLVLVEAMADAYGLKRSAKGALLERIASQLSEFEA